jgi:hypothetical protein
MIDKFKNIFEGLTIAYGQYQKGEKGENGKQKGRPLLYVSKLRKNYLRTTLKVLDLRSELSRLQKHY